MNKRTWFWKTLSDSQKQLLRESEAGRKFYSLWQNARRDARISWIMGLLASVPATFLITILLYVKFEHNIVFLILFSLIVFTIILFSVKYAYLVLNHKIFKSHYDEMTKLVSLSKGTDLYKKVLCTFYEV